MYVRIWEYSVPVSNVELFGRAYGPSGDWAQLFNRGPGYAGTELCRSADRPDHFVTVDRWETGADWARFLSRQRGPYDTLDASLAGLATLERSILEGSSWPRP